MEVTLRLYRHTGSDRFAGVRARVVGGGAIIYEAWDSRVAALKEPAVTLPPMGVVDAALLARGLMHSCPDAIIEVDEFAQSYEPDGRPAGRTTHG